MVVDFKTKLVGCPPTCKSLKLDVRTITKRCRGEIAKAVIVADCEHSDVCKFREVTLCEGNATSADAISLMIR